MKDTTMKMIIRVLALTMAFLIALPMFLTGCGTDLASSSKSSITSAMQTEMDADAS